MQLCLEVFLPDGLRLIQFRRRRLHEFLQPGNLSLPLLALQLLLGGVKRLHRSFVHTISIRRVVEDGEQAEVIFLGDGVVLVSMTLGTGHRGAHPNGHGGVHAIHDGDVAVFLVARAALVVRHRIAMKRGRGQLLIGGVVQQIAGDLLQGELIERLVGVQCANDVIAIRPNRPGRIIRVTAGIRVARLIEPQPRPVFPKGFLLQQPVHHSLVGIRLAIGDKLIHLRQRRRESREVERNPADQRRSLRLGSVRQLFRFKAGEDEMVHGIPGPPGITHPGQSRAPRLHVGPMAGIFRPLLDPFLEQFNLLEGELLSGVRRRHLVIQVRGRDATEHLAFFRMPRDDCMMAIPQIGPRAFRQIEAQRLPAALPLLGIGPMAAKAVLRQDAPHVIEIHRISGQGDACPFSQANAQHHGQRPVSGGAGRAVGNPVIKHSLTHAVVMMPD